MTWIARLLLLLAAPIAAWFVARDALNFQIVETFVAMLLVVMLVAGLALLSWLRKSRSRNLE